MNLLKIFSKYKAEDLEKESLISNDSTIGLSSIEKWELEKKTNPNTDYNSWKTHSISNSISDSLGKTIKLED